MFPISSKHAAALTVVQNLSRVLPGLHAALAVICCLFGHMLVVLDDFELYEAGQPLPLHHVRKLVKGLKRPLFRFCWEVCVRKRSLVLVNL